MAFSDYINTINFGLFGAGTTEIDAIAGIVDLYPEEDHAIKITKTKYPVEDGSSRVDNFVVEPKQLVLRGLVSDLQPFSGGLVSISDAYRPKEAWGRIHALAASGDLVTVTTLLGLYENMQVVSADTYLSSQTGRSLFFTIMLEETLIAETQTVQISPVKTSSEGPAETKGSDIQGGQKQSEAPATEEQTTFLQDSIEFVGGFF